MSRSAFSLIELLVVLTLLALLLGLGFGLTGRQQRGAEVRAAAEELSATFAKVRRMAMSRQAVYAVVFNIENAPGSSGRVLNNRGGGHWYRVLGPSGYRQTASSVVSSIPYPEIIGSGASRMMSLANFPDLNRAVAKCWMGDRITLKPGRVRFLAIGDTDEGSRARGQRSTDAGTALYSQAGDTTYPRPWFGYFDATTKRLHPWGGYDPAIANSGFRYEGKDGDIAGCRNPATRTYDNNFDIGTGDVDFTTPGDADVAVVVQDEPRPLVNAAWLDACFIFMPDGRVVCGEFNRGRRLYADAQVPHANALGGNGVRDRAKMPVQSGRETFTYGGDPTKTFTDDIPEVAHFDRHTGGWFITLAPDSRDDRDEFPDAKAALASVTPMWRVFIGANGSTRALPVANPAGWLDGKPVWPASPAVWTSTSTSASDPLWRDCRLGWLHEPSTGGLGSTARLRPRGSPIIDVVTERMMTDRIWWLDP